MRLSRFAKRSTYCPERRRRIPSCASRSVGDAPRGADRQRANWRTEAIERVLDRAGAVSVAKLTRTATHWGVVDLLPAIARKVARTWDSDDPIVEYRSMDRGVRWSIAVARDLLALGAEDHLALPEVRAAVQRCLDIEGPRRPQEGSWWAAEEAKFREPIMQRVRAALASTKAPDGGASE